MALLYGLGHLAHLRERTEVADNDVNVFGAGRRSNLASGGFGLRQISGRQDHGEALACQRLGCGLPDPFGRARDQADGFCHHAGSMTLETSQKTGSNGAKVAAA